MTTSSEMNEFDTKELVATDDISKNQDGESQEWNHSSRASFTTSGFYPSSQAFISRNRLRRKSAQDRYSKAASTSTTKLPFRRCPIPIDKDLTFPEPPAVRQRSSSLRPPAARNTSAGSDTCNPSRSLEIMRRSISTSRPLIEAKPLELRPKLSRARTPGRAVFSIAARSVSRIRAPPLPVVWTIIHDRALCVLDARNYTLDQSIKKLRRAFPELMSCMLSPGMIDRRLRTLDQIPEVDYFRVGMEFRSRYSDTGKTATFEDSSSSSLSSTLEKGKNTDELSDSALRKKCGANLSIWPDVKNQYHNHVNLYKSARPMTMIEERPTSFLETSDENRGRDVDKMKKSSIDRINKGLSKRTRGVLNAIHNLTI